MAVAGYKASAYVTTGVSTAITNAPCTNAGDNKTFTISNSAYRYLDPTIIPAVQTSPDGVTWTSIYTGYSIQNIGAIITLAIALTGSAPAVRFASANYLVYSQAIQATTLELQVSTDIADNTTFYSCQQNGGFKTKQALQSDATYKMSQWWVDNFYLTMLGAGLMVIAFYTGANTNQRFEGYALLKTDSIKIAQNGIIDESLEFEAYGPVYPIQS
jgi:hypothetical protein